MRGESGPRTSMVRGAPDSSGAADVPQTARPLTSIGMPGPYVVDTVPFCT